MKPKERKAFPGFDLLINSINDNDPKKFQQFIQKSQLNSFLVLSLVRKSISDLANVKLKKSLDDVMSTITKLIDKKDAERKELKIFYFPSDENKLWVSTSEIYAELLKMKTASFNGFHKNIRTLQGMNLIDTKIEITNKGKEKMVSVTFLGSLIDSSLVK